MKNILLIIVIGLFFVSLVSSLNSQDVMNYWMDQGLSESEAGKISNGSLSKTDEGKIIEDIRIRAEQEKAREQLNETQMAQELIDEKNKKDIAGIILFLILGLMAFGSVVALFIFFMGYYGKI